MGAFQMFVNGLKQDRFSLLKAALSFHIIFQISSQQMFCSENPGVHQGADQTKILLFIQKTGNIQFFFLPQDTRLWFFIWITRKLTYL
jgi:hypothetical protein